MLATRPTVIGVCAMYIVMFRYSYRHIESVLYPEICLVYAPPPAYYELMGLALAMLPSLWMPKTLSRPSHLAYWILYLMVFAPSMFIPFHVMTLPPDRILTLTTTLCGLFSLLALIASGKPIILPPPNFARKDLIRGAILITGGLIFLVGYVSGFKIDFSMANIYDRRLEARELVVGGGLTAYAMATLGSSVSPLLMAFGYVKKMPIALACGVAGVLSLFSFAGTKHDLAAPFYLMGILCLLRKREQSPGAIVGLASAFLIGLSVFQYFTTGNNFISVYFIRRSFLVPSLLTGLYWDFFDGQRHVYYGDSFMRWLYSSPYELPMARLIGDSYLHSAENNANANIWATSFGHAGFVGMTISTIILGFLFRLIDGFAKTVDLRVVCLMISLFSLSWANGAIETSLLTYGVLPSIMLLYLLGSDEELIPKVSPTAAGPTHRQTFPVKQ
ncbi:MAG: hypothetical protein FJ267_03125, partial [Planctomycetes bacterium]|nr:hypothetical protein [Planctomycetota bacterium]